MQGRRREDGTAPYLFEPGDYSKHHMVNSAGDEWEQWFMRAPFGEPFYLASEHQPDRNGRAHHVEEHEDGTISVLPQPENGNSIKTRGEEWHGWLRRGEWVSQA